MANLKSDDRDLRSAGSPPAEPSAGAAAAWVKAIVSVRERILHPRNRLIAVTALLTAIACAALIAGSYLAKHSAGNTIVERKVAPPASSVWKPIAERVQQAAQGRFPVSEGILTFSKSAQAADAEIRSVVGTYALPTYGAAQIESGESWGVTGANRDDFVMYVHNFLSAPITAMIVRISEGSCASYDAETAATWASAYLADALPGEKEAIFHATLPSPYNLPSYCAVVYRVYSSRAP